MNTVEAPKLSTPPEVEEIELAIHKAVKQDVKGTLDWLTERALQIASLECALNDYQTSHRLLERTYANWVELNNTYTFEE